MYRRQFLFHNQNNEEVLRQCVPFQKQGIADHQKKITFHRPNAWLMIGDSENSPVFLPGYADCLPDQLVITE